MPKCRIIAFASEFQDLAADAEDHQHCACLWRARHQKAQEIVRPAAWTTQQPTTVLASLTAPDPAHAITDREDHAKQPNVALCRPSSSGGARSDGSHGCYAAVNGGSLVGNHGRATKPTTGCGTHVSGFDAPSRMTSFAGSAAIGR